MNPRKQTLTLSVATILVSASLSEFVDRLIHATYIRTLDSNVNDGALILYTLQLAFIYRPLIAAVSGMILWGVGQVILRKERRSYSCFSILLIAFFSSLVSIVWAGVEIFMIGNYWP